MIIINFLKLLLVMMLVIQLWELLHTPLPPAYVFEQQGDLSVKPPQILTVDYATYYCGKGESWVETNFRMGIESSFGSMSFSLIRGKIETAQGVVEHKLIGVGWLTRFSVSRATDVERSSINHVYYFEATAVSVLNNAYQESELWTTLRFGIGWEACNEPFQGFRTRFGGLPTLRYTSKGAWELFFGIFLELEVVIPDVSSF